MATSARRRATALRYLLLVLVSAVVLFPAYSALIVALKPLHELGDLGVLVPDHLEFGHFADAWSRANMDRYMLNSTIVAVLITVGQLVTSIITGYAFALLRLPGKNLLFFVFLATLMVPTEVTIVANFETIQRLHWIDSYQALVVPFIAFAFGTFMLRQAFLVIPGELRDAAAMDGYGYWGFLFKVAIPLVKPTIAALSVFSFLLAWNQYLWPLLVTNEDQYRTVQIGIRQLVGESDASLNLLMAGTILAALPIVVVLVAFERQLVRGLTSGAVKG